MNLLFDFLPIILFFIMYQWYGIYAATAVIILSTTLHFGLTLMMKNKVEKIQTFTLIAVVLFGGATLIHHDPLFIKWKPSIIYWVMSAAFLFSSFFGEKTLTEKLIDTKINLLPSNWHRINHLFSGFFCLMGGLNLYVAYHYNTHVWVHYKLFGTLGLTLLFMMLIAAMMLRYNRDKDLNSSVTIDNPVTNQKNNSQRLPNG
jgi:intracellular septation protein